MVFPILVQQLLFITLLKLLFSPIVIQGITLLLPKETVNLI
jgi:hypothetical protein